jgi:hypothetical protein
MTKDINEDHMIYESPIKFPESQTALAQQLIKLKGKMDTQCVALLKELSDLMAMDEDVTRFLYTLTPSTYAEARFTDWIQPYLQGQYDDQMKYTTNHYRNKLEDTKAALANMERVKPLFEKLQAEEMAALEKALQEKNEYTDMAPDWLALTDPTKEIIKHYPPRMVVGKLTTPEEHYWTFDGDETIKLEMVQVHGEYCYSAPTGLYNLACPEKKRKTNLHYMSESYKAWKANQIKETKKEGEENKDEEDIGIDLEYWEKAKKVGPLLLRVKLDFKAQDKDVKIWYKIKSKSDNADNINVWLPESYRKVHLSSGHRRLSESLLIKDPSKGYFFKDKDDIEIDMKVTVQRDLSSYRKMQGTGKQVRITQSPVAQYGMTEYDNDIENDIEPSPDGDEDDGNAYYQYQEHQSGANTGIQGNADFTISGQQDNGAVAQLLNLEMGAGGDIDPQDNIGADRRSNSSTDAVAFGAYGTDDRFMQDGETGADMNDPM